MNDLLRQHINAFASKLGNHPALKLDREKLLRVIGFDFFGLCTGPTQAQIETLTDDRLFRWFDGFQLGAVPSKLPLTAAERAKLEKADGDGRWSFANQFWNTP